MQKFGGGFGVLKITALDVALPLFPKRRTDQTQVAKEWARLLLVFFSQNHAFRLGPEVATVAPNGPMLLGDLGARRFKG